MLAVLSLFLTLNVAGAPPSTLSWDAPGRFSPGAFSILARGLDAAREQGHQPVTSGDPTSPKSGSPSPLSGHQPIIQVPDSTTGSYSEWPDQQTGFEIHVDLPVSWRVSSVSVTSDPSIKGLPESVPIEGGVGVLEFFTPSDTGYYTLTLTATHSSGTYVSRFVLFINQPVGSMAVGGGS